MGCRTWLEAIFCWRNWILGFAVLFLARTQCALYYMNNIQAGDTFFNLCRRRVLVNGIIFVVFFLAFVALLLTSYRTTDYRTAQLRAGALQIFPQLCGYVVVSGAVPRRSGDGAICRR